MLRHCQTFHHRPSPTFSFPTRSWLNYLHKSPSHQYNRTKNNFRFRIKNKTKHQTPKHKLPFSDSKPLATPPSSWKTGETPARPPAAEEARGPAGSPRHAGGHARTPRRKLAGAANLTSPPAAARKAKEVKGDLPGREDRGPLPPPWSVSPRPPDSRRLAHHADPTRPPPSRNPLENALQNRGEGRSPRRSPRRVGLQQQRRIPLPSPCRATARLDPPALRLRAQRPLPTPRRSGPAPRRLTHLHQGGGGRSQGVGLKGPGENLCRRAVLRQARSAMPPPPDSPGLRAGPAELKGRGLLCRRRDEERRQRPRGPTRAPCSPPRAGPAPPHGLSFC